MTEVFTFFLGQILDYSIQTNSGIITADDQNRYEFTGAEWRGQKPPARGDKVDFSINEDGQATEVYVALSTATPIQNLSQQLDKISNQDQAESQFNMIDWY